MSDRVTPPDGSDLHGELSRSSSLLRATLESTADGILVVDREGRIVLFNRRFADMWRIPDAVLAQRDDGAALAWVVDQLRDADAFLAKVRELYADPDASSYDVLFFKDGRVFERYSQPQVVDGQSVGRVWSFRDVTEHRLAESALRESEHRSRALLINSTEGIVTFSADGAILWANPAAGRMLDLHLADVRGRSFLEYVHPDDRGAVAGALAEVAATPGLRVACRARCRRSNGSWAVLEGTLINLREEPGLHSIVVHFRDVTESLALQEQLTQSQKMEAVGRLAGGIAHDFNNLLTAIVGHVELLKDELPPASQALEDIAEIEAAAARATALTQQLLAFSRRQVLQPKVLHVDGVVEGMRRMLERLIGEHIRFEFRGGATGNVRADPGQLSQVVLNLVVNARDAMPKGGALRIETSDREIDEWYVRRHPGITAGSWVVLTVADTGVGMDEATRLRVFEPFFTTRRNGSGLGLSTAYGIVRQSGGHLAVESEPGKGSVFTIFLPRVEGPAEVTPVPGAVAAPDGSETVLVVEDEAVVRDLAARLLRQRGYTVIEADGGAAALAAASQHAGPIHLVLTDVVMPDRTGTAVAEALRKDRADVRVLYMSGYSPETLVEQGVLTREAEFIQKPFAPAALAAKVREVLERTLAGG